MTTFEFVTVCLGLNKWTLELCDIWEEKFDLFDTLGISGSMLGKAIDSWKYGSRMDECILDYYLREINERIIEEYKGTDDAFLVRKFVEEKFDYSIDGRCSRAILDGHYIQSLNEAVKIIDEFIENYKLITGKEETNE